VGCLFQAARETANSGNIVGKAATFKKAKPCKSAVVDYCVLVCLVFFCIQCVPCKCDVVHFCVLVCPMFSVFFEIDMLSMQLSV